MGFDWTRLNDKITIGLNNALKVPGFVPKYSIFSDTGLWSQYRDLKLDPVTKVICQGRARDQFLRYERCTFKGQVFHFNHVAKAMSEGRRPKPVCDPYNDDLFVARTVATGGIMMAYKLGARRVFLLGIDGYKLPGPGGGVYYHDGTSKGVERRREHNPDVQFKGKVEKHTDLLSQDRHEWWRRNMRELRAWFDHLGAYQEPFKFRNADGHLVFGSNVFNLSGKSTIDAWEKVKVKTVLGRGCFKEASDA